MINTNFEKTYNDLIEESKHSTHGFWKPEDFRQWGKKALKLLDELYGVTNQYYTLFLRTHHEALVLGTSDSRFGTYVSLCNTILNSAYKESDKNSEA